MKKILLSTVLIIFSSTLFSQIQLSGIVTDAVTKMPLSKAIININGIDYTLITDENGFFSANVKKGQYILEATKSNYRYVKKSFPIAENTILSVSLSPNSSQTISSISVNNLPTQKQVEPKPTKTNTSTTTKGNSKEKVKEATNPASVSGVVLDKYTKQPIGDATVLLKGLKRKFLTGADGRFYFKINNGGEYNIIVKAPDYESETAKIAVYKAVDLTVFLNKKKIIKNDTFPELTTETVVISRTRATKNTPTAVRKIDKEELNENNLGKDLPYLLELTPSLVATSDGGNGVGYTGLRIRGSDMTRINFTLNGFPVNDAESQGVFLVNTPDLASSIEDIQVQRGIGTSTNGAGAFGASININTNKIHEKPYAEFNNSFATFNTFKNTIKLGTGKLFKHFAFDGRFSHLHTDGYIDRARAKMFAYALTGAYFNKRTTIRLNVFSGFEKTYQAWNGVDYTTMQTNRTFNSAGTDYDPSVTPYDNEIDNYRQDNYQLSFSHKFNYGLTANIGLHYTKGKGYFEQFKVGQDLLEYGKINASSNTNLVRRRWLDNQFYGTIYSLNYKKGIVNATLGGAWNQYEGDHFGEIIWAENSQNIKKDEVYYFNDALKTDFNVFLKGEFKVFKRFILFGDIQYRRVSYSADGIDNDQRRLFEDVDYNFVNPKAGLTVLLGKKMRSQVYASFAMANREPTRNDFIDNANEPKPENMIDIEAGFRHKSKKLSYGINAFYMKYKNQLVLTGELNDVGSAVRTNVDNSFRTGLEVEIAYEPFKYLGVKGAGTWSLNEIESFTFTNYLGNTETHDKIKIAYSPYLVGNFTVYSKPFKGFEIALINKYVSEQFLDNTSSKSKILTPYFLNDARVSYSITPKFMREIKFILKANNILNVKYSSNGYVYYDAPYFYPQAGTNFEGGINLKF